MTVSILLRLRAEAIDLAGQAEVVETGETSLFRDGKEMLAFVRRVTDESVSAEATQTEHHSQGGSNT